MRKIWFLLIMLGLLAGCNRGGGPGVPAGPFTLVGTVTIINDCDQQLASIPGNITVKAALKNAAGNVAVPGSANIALNPAAGGGATKTGTYSITVRWPGGPAGAATTWGDFEETLVGGGDICEPIKCETRKCQNGATRVRTTPVTQPNTTNDIRIRCACLG